MRRPADPARLLAFAFCGLLAGCASAPLVEGKGLSSYAELKQSDGMITKSRLSVVKDAVLSAKTIKIEPTTFPAPVAPNLTDAQRALVANAVDRSLCITLSDRFTVVAPAESADLVVRASVTQITETNEVAAGVSAAASVGMVFVDLGVPVPVPRIPIGLGTLSIEAEALDGTGRQKAAMVWARGANALFSAPRASKTGDAYELADAFGDDFGTLLVKGKSPFEGGSIQIPSWQKINSAAGFPPKYKACEQFGRAPGLTGLVGSHLGLPPEWTDKGANSADAPPTPANPVRAPTH